jgi:hypothetical protein
MQFTMLLKTQSRMIAQPAYLHIEARKKCKSATDVSKHNAAAGMHTAMACCSHNVLCDSIRLPYSIASEGYDAVQTSQCMLAVLESHLRRYCSARRSLGHGKSCSVTRHQYTQRRTLLSVLQLYKMHDKQHCACCALSSTKILYYC